MCAVQAALLILAEAKVDPKFEYSWKDVATKFMDDESKDFSGDAHKEAKKVKRNVIVGIRANIERCKAFFAFRERAQRLADLSDIPVIEAMTKLTLEDNARAQVVKVMKKGAILTGKAKEAEAAVAAGAGLGAMLSPSSTRSKSSARTPTSASGGSQRHREEDADTDEEDTDFEGESDDEPAAREYKCELCGCINIIT